ncbi:hypothetical protein [Spongiactinospora sp. TRM90649]|uniref:hypothetical protein n=1 Tax=Spongiactinospora sp. TRM90649 TaxID=3031114 RepID=UPI0023F814C9|nr:hypothetical protein [Spongiactinospora sp. TRM90649]MDF5757449.1 hypothetical protein [Spongiactinospora sp. TRM90649]
MVVIDEPFWLDTGSGAPVVLLYGGFLDHGMCKDPNMERPDAYNAVLGDFLRTLAAA